jgi:hypothetical protein
MNKWVIKRMFGDIWFLIKQSVSAFIDDEALTRGAAIAFYTVTSIGPVLFIVVAIAGLVFGNCSPPVVVSQGARPIRLRVLRAARQERLADIDARLQ